MLTRQGQMAPDLLASVVALRVRVWSELVGQKTAASRFGWDSHDLDAWHVLVLRERTIIGCARLSLVDAFFGVPERCSFAACLSEMRFPVVVFTRLVVDTRFRGHQIGTAIDRRRIMLASELEANEIWMEARTHRANELARLGLLESGRCGDGTIAGDWRIYCNPLGCRKGVENQLPERPVGCFAQLAPDPFSTASHQDRP